MAFVADPVLHRTFDAERGLSLVYVTSNSDGDTTYALIGPDGRVPFLSRMEDKVVPPERRREFGGAVRLIDWTIYRIGPGPFRCAAIMDLGQMQAAIREALEVYGIGDGLGTPARVTVTFR